MWWGGGRTTGSCFISELAVNLGCERQGQREQHMPTRRIEKWRNMSLKHEQVPVAGVEDAQGCVVGKAAGEAGSSESGELCLPGDAWTTIFILIHNEHVPSVLVSSGCCKKLPQTGWLTTIEIYSFTIRRWEIKKSRCQQGWFLLETLRDDLFRISLLTSGGCWQSSAFFGL